MAAWRMKWSWHGPQRSNTQIETDTEEGTYAKKHPYDDVHQAVSDPLIQAAGNATAGERQQSPRMRRPYWLSEMESPYGSADDDGTLKQLDSSNWRRVPRLTLKSHKRFVPQTRQQGTGQGAKSPQRWQADSTVALDSKKPMRAIQTSPQKPMRAGSTWLLQLSAAVALVLVGVFAHNSSVPLAGRLNQVYQDAFHTDYTQTIAPQVDKFLQSHNVSVPTFLSQSGALDLHVPLRGQVVQDFSATQPEMTIVGFANESVQAVGSGTVMRVVVLTGGTMVVINHGSLGSSYYFGLQTASVKTGEAVQSGQVIGSLPGTPSPKLMFELEQGGKPVNPHQYIVFSKSAMSP